MKTFRKVLSLTLMLALVLTSLIYTSVFAAVTFSDVDETTQYNVAIYELVSDGVLNGYEDGTFKPEGTITRAEFAKVIGVAREGGSALWDAKESKFSDMSGHWAIPYVAYASNAGIVNGYEDGSFRPEQPVTYAEAVKMIVCSLGYGPVVDTTLTPWYTGYINIANQIGLTKGAATLADNGASRGLVAQLISNMKDCKRLIQTGTDASGKPLYSTSDKDIITSEEEYEDEGVVLGVYDNTLRGSEITLTRSQINIDGETYTLSNELKERDDLVDYIGKRVDFVYEGSNKYTVTSIKIAGTNEVKELTVEQLSSISADKIYYYENPEKDTKEKSFTLDEDIYIVYNGFGVPSADITDEFIEEAFNIETGLITFYNNDSDSDMDVAFIENYKTYFLNATPTKNNGVYTINDKNGYEPQIKINEDDAVVYRVTTAGGAPTSGQMTNLVSKAVVSIATPLNRTEGTTIMVSTATVSGAIAEMDEDYEEIEISSKTYKVAPYFRRLLEQDAKTYGFDVGTNVKLYLDYLGRIVSSEINVTSDPYGYLMDYAIVGDSFDGEVQVKILTTGNKWVTYPLRETVRVNGKSFEQSNVPDELKASASVINDGKPEKNIENARAAQLIKYKTATENGRTVISDISTIGTEDDGEITLSKYTDCTSPLTYNRSGYSFTDADGKIQFTMNSSTVVFAVPADRKAGGTAYKKVSYTYFSNEGSYNVEAYDIASGGTTAKVVIYYLGAGSASNLNQVNAATPPYIITDIKKTTNDGVDCHRVTFLQMGESDVAKTVEVFTEDLNVMSEYSVGDVVKYVATDGVIDNVQKIYVDGELVGATGNYISKDYDTKDYFQVMLGTVYTSEIDDNGVGTIGVSPNFAEEGDEGYTFDEGAWKSFTANSSTAYYQMEAGRNSDELQLRTYADLIPAIDNNNPETASKVLVVVYNKVIKGVYILND